MKSHFTNDMMGPWGPDKTCSKGDLKLNPRLLGGNCLYVYFFLIRTGPESRRLAEAVGR